jgi:DNA primase small subunit
VCVPIDPDHCDDFDPFAVPTLQQLCKELDNHQTGNGSDKRVAGMFLIARFVSTLYDPLTLAPIDYEKTSLKKYVAIFEKFVDGLLKEVMERKRGKTLV